MMRLLLAASASICGCRRPGRRRAQRALARSAGPGRPPGRGQLPALRWTTWISRSARFLSRSSISLATASRSAAEALTTSELVRVSAETAKSCDGGRPRGPPRAAKVLWMTPTRLAALATFRGKMRRPAPRSAAASSLAIRSVSCFMTSGSAEMIRWLVAASATIRAAGAWDVRASPRPSGVVMVLLPTLAMRVWASSSALAFFRANTCTLPARSWTVDVHAGDELLDHPMLVRAGDDHQDVGPRIGRDADRLDRFGLYGS